LVTATKGKLFTNSIYPATSPLAKRLNSVLPFLLPLSVHHAAANPSRERDRIAFTISTGKFDSDGAFASDLYICDLHGKHKKLIAKKILETIEDGGGMSPQGWGDTFGWSPDRNWIYYERRAGKKTETFIADSDGDHAEKIKLPNGMVAGGWEANHVLCFTPEGSDRQIDYAYDPITKKLKRHKSKSGDYSPNQRFKVVDQDRKYSGTLWTDLDLVDTATHKRTTVLRQEEAGLMEVWSPDSNYICANWGLDDNSGPTIVNTKTFKRYTSKERGLCEDIFWSPDSRYVAWSNDDQGAGSVMLFDTRSGKEKQLASPSTDIDGWTTDSRNIVMHNDESVFLVPVYGPKPTVVIKVLGLTSVRVAGYQRFERDNGGE